MNDFNLSLLIGRAVDDVKIKNVKKYFRYSFTIAINYYSKNSKRKYVDFIPICFFQKYQDKQLDNLKKGDLAVIEGRINVRSYEKNGESKWISEVIGSRYRIISYNKEDKVANEMDVEGPIDVNKKKHYLEEVNHSQDKIDATEMIEEDELIEEKYKDA